MKHEYLTCDRCGNKISRKLPWGGGEMKLITDYAELFPLNLKEELLRLEQKIENMTLDFSVNVDIGIDYKRDSFDLCHKCGKELKSFLYGKEI